MYVHITKPIIVNKYKHKLSIKARYNMAHIREHQLNKY